MFCTTIGLQFFSRTVCGSHSDARCGSCTRRAWTVFRQPALVMELYAVADTVFTVTLISRI